MGAYIKIDDESKYYPPLLIVDSATDRADEIAVGSNGGSKGYIADSGTQDSAVSLSVVEKKLMDISQGFLFLLGKFSNLWAGSGAVKLKLSGSLNGILFKEFLTDNALSEYDYVVELAVVDGANHVVTKPLTLDSSVYDASIGKYKNTFKISANELIFGSNTASTALTDLSSVSVYLRGYFLEDGFKNTVYDGGTIELDWRGGVVPFRLRGFKNTDWSLIMTIFGSINKTSGTFPEGVDYAPVSEVITASFPTYSSSQEILRAGVMPIYRNPGSVITDFIPVSQFSANEAFLNFSMRAIRLQSAKARSFKFSIFDSESHGWSITNAPEFVSVTEDSGVGDTDITVSFEANTTGAARFGYITITDSTVNQTYQIPCVQWGVESFVGVENIVPGQKKTVAAYVVTIEKNVFDMEVAYYNAAMFNLYLRQIGFDIKDFSAGGNGLATLNMKSGSCAGRDFNITGCEYVEEQDRWKLTLDRLEDSSVGMVFPNLSFPIEAGDRFVLTDILMPEVYILVAERRLLAKARVYYDRNSKLRYLYDLEIDSKWMKNEGVHLRPGMYMQIADADLIGANPAYVLIDTVTVVHGDSNIPVYKVTLREKLYLPE